MQKLMPLLFGTMLRLSVTSTPGQEKKPPTTLEDDWNILCRFQWVNSDPKDAWALLPKDWKGSYTRQGSKGWSRIELSFKEPAKKFYTMSGGWHYLDGNGKEKTLPALYGVVIGLHEEKGNRFLLLSSGKAKIRYVLKDGVLILNGVDDAFKSGAPTVFTGTYKGMQRKEKK
jgi:hypothetical protein